MKLPQHAICVNIKLPQHAFSFDIELPQFAFIFYAIKFPQPACRNTSTLSGAQVWELYQILSW